LVIVQKKVAGLSAESLGRFIVRARRAAGLRGRVNVLLTTNAAMRSLNSQFRGRDKPTDVLSFPAAREKRNDTTLAGELAISAEIATQNAVRLGHPTATEVKVLVLHGILHLAGYDHERDNGSMARKEAKLRQTLKLPLALIERSHSPQSPGSTRRLPQARSRRTG
jgi:probable rRNA maturation factor